jgi:hypothetical protein
MTAVTKRYHQAEEMATYLLSEIDSVNYDFKELFELFGWGDEVVINDLNQLKLFRNQVKTHLIDSCNKLDHEFFIPGLIEFMSHYYMDRQPVFYGLIITMVSQVMVEALLRLLKRIIVVSCLR